MADRIITVTNPSIVTNDTLAGYNNYSDIDGQLGTTMTPTEATNGHTITLSDGETHQVTSKPVGTTNGEFSASISNAVEVVTTPSIILFSDTFAGTTLDPQWTKVNPDTGVTMSQDDEYDFIGDGTGSVDPYENYLYAASNGITMATGITFSFDLQLKTGAGQEFFAIGLFKETPVTNTSAVRINHLSNGNIAGNVRIDTTNDTSSAISTSTTEKISYKAQFDGVEWIFSKWTGSAWTNTVTVVNTGDTGTFYPGISFTNSASTAGCGIQVENFYLCSENFTTQYPI